MYVIYDIAMNYIPVYHLNTFCLRFHMSCLTFEWLLSLYALIHRSTYRLMVFDGNYKRQVAY